MSEEVKTLVYTLLHQRQVQDYMMFIALELQRRALKHDLSKLSSTEWEGLVAINSIAREQGYASPDYQASLQSDMVKAHWAANDHHPEHFEQGIAEMSLCAIIEMVCDWKAVAVQKKLHFYDILKENYERFKVTPEQKYLIERIVMELES